MLDLKYYRRDSFRWYKVVHGTTHRASATYLCTLPGYVFYSRNAWKIYILMQRSEIYRLSWTILKINMKIGAVVLERNRFWCTIRLDPFPCTWTSQCIVALQCSTEHILDTSRSVQNARSYCNHMLCPELTLYCARRRLVVKYLRYKYGHRSSVP